MAAANDRRSRGMGLSLNLPSRQSPRPPTATVAAASKWCSGNGNVFVDTVGLNPDGTAACECKECFTGADCSVSVLDCVADADAGDPLLFEAYWRENADLGTTVIPGWYRMGYRPQDSATMFYSTTRPKTALVTEPRASKKSPWLVSDSRSLCER